MNATVNPAGPPPATSPQVSVEQRRLLRSSWPVFSQDEPHIDGFSAVIVVFRHIYTYLPGYLWPPHGSESLRLLQVARKVLHDGNRRIVYEEKQTALLDIVDDPPNQLDQLGFLSLIQNEHIIKGFWARREYLLHIGIMHTMAPGSQEWGPPDELEDDYLAQVALVPWDGSQPLSECLDEGFGLFRDLTTGVKHFRCPHMPILIRVHYTPSAQLEDAPGFNDIRKFRHTGKVWYPKDTEPKGLHLVERSNEYQLIATVRLRRDQGEPDFVRLYSGDGANILPPDSARRIVDDSWHVGEPGCSYVLFFIKTGSRPVADVGEVALPDDDRVKRAHLLAKALPRSQSDFTDVPVRLGALPSVGVDEPSPRCDVSPAAAPLDPGPVPTNSDEQHAAPQPFASDDVLGSEHLTCPSPPSSHYLNEGDRFLDVLPAAGSPDPSFGDGIDLSRGVIGPTRPGHSRYQSRSVFPLHSQPVNPPRTRDVDMAGLHPDQGRLIVGRGEEPQRIGDLRGPSPPARPYRRGQRRVDSYRPSYPLEQYDRYDNERRFPGFEAPQAPGPNEHDQALSLNRRVEQLERDLHDLRLQLEQLRRAPSPVRNLDAEPFRTSGQQDREHSPRWRSSSPRYRDRSTDDYRR